MQGRDQPKKIEGHSKHQGEVSGNHMKFDISLSSCPRGLGEINH